MQLAVVADPVGNANVSGYFLFHVINSDFKANMKQNGSNKVTASRLLSFK